MTIICVPAAAAGDHVRAAHEDDASVVRGLLQLDISPWSVRMSS
jgi:hypothetical protein